MKKNKELLKKIKKDLPRFFDAGIDMESLEEITEYQKLDQEYDKERNHLILVLAKNRKLWKWIDKTYEIRKHEYYRCYKSTFFSDTPLKEVYSTETKEYINKLAGIDKWCRENGTEEPILKIIQKDYNKLYSRFKVGIEEFDLDDFISKKLKDVAKATKDETQIFLDKNNQLEDIITITIYLATIYDVEVRGFLWKRVIDGHMNELFSGIKATISAQVFLDGIDESDMEKYIKMILEVESKKLAKCENIDDLYSLILAEQSIIARNTSSIMYNAQIKPSSIEIGEKILSVILDDKASASPLNMQEITTKILDDNAKEYMDKIKTTEMNNMTAFLANISKTIGLDREVLLGIPINIGLIKSGILTAFDNDVEEYLDMKIKIDNNFRFKVLTTITIMAMLEHYKTIKPSSFGQEEESSLLEIEELKKELENKNKEVIALQEKMNNIAQSKNSQIQDALNELDLSKKSIKRLKKEVEKFKENQTEFIAMKEYIYKNNMSDDEIAITIELDEDSTEEKVSYLNDKKIAIFGGHPNWVNKLKKFLPDARYIDTNACSSRKFNRLDKYDILVICNLFIGHHLSGRVSDAIKNVKSKKVIIVDDVNTDLIIDSIYDAVKKYEKSGM